MTMVEPEPLGADETRPQSKRRGLFDRTTITLGLMAIAGGIGCFLSGGWDLVRHVLTEQAQLLLDIVPLLTAGLLIAGLVKGLIPKETIRRLLGGSTGWRSLAIGSAAGMLTPGGPFVSFPLVYVLHRAGADIGTLAAYVTAWAVLSLSRLLIWEMAFLGAEFALVRFLVSLPLPLLAGWLARRLMPMVEDLASRRVTHQQETNRP